MDKMLIVLPKNVLLAALAGGLLSGVLLLQMGLSASAAPISVLLFVLAGLVASDFRYAASSASASMASKIKSVIVGLYGMPIYMRFFTALLLTVFVIAFNVLIDIDPRRDAYLSLATPIVVSALLFGFEAASFALLFTCAACFYFFIPPKFDFNFHSWADVELLGEFVAFVLLVAFVLKFVITKAIASDGFTLPAGAGFWPRPEGDARISRKNAFQSDDFKSSVWARVGDLETALAERESLLRDAASRHSELRHRIKNDLQALYFLASLEAENSRHPEVFRRLLLRLRSAAELHNALDDDGSGLVSMGDYLPALSLSLQNMLEDRFKLETTVDPDIKLDHRRAKNVGLIYCEAAMNAAKHAFPPSLEGRLDVCFMRANGGYRLTVTDNGVAAPPLEPKLGLKLMNDFAKRLGGALQVSASPTGTTICLTFKDAPQARPD